jgi:histidinol-phosphate aminotransferase
MGVAPVNTGGVEGSLSKPADFVAPRNGVPEPRPAPTVEGLRAFVPPPRPAEIDLFLDSNEGPPVPREAIEWMVGLDPAMLRSYPDASHLQNLWAVQLGVAPDHVLITAGGDEATDRACRAFLCPGRELILPVPTFEMLGHYPRLVGAAILEVPWAPAEPYPLEAVLAKISPRTGMIAVVSPNNPTGTVATAEDLSRLSAAAPGAVLLIDQAYVEFTDAEGDLLHAALQLPNAVVLRTLSKAWGLAGLRIGCAVGRPEILKHLRIAGPVFSTSSPALAIAATALARDAAKNGVEGYIARITRERERLVRLIDGRGGAAAWPSRANFVLARFAPPHDAAAVHAALYSAGISVRRLAPVWNAYPLENCIRISCPGDPQSFDRLAAGLLAVLGGPVLRGA